MATKPYVKLDLDWRDDPKVMLLEARYGKAAVLDFVMLMCVLGEFYGSFSWDDDMAVMHMQRVMRRGKKACETLIGRCAECGLVDAEAWESMRRVGSARSIRDGEARTARRDYALAASAAAAEKRRADGD